MNCPSCGSTTTSAAPQKTALGYRTCRCSACQCRFNERTGTPFNHLQVPTDIVLLVGLWRLRYKLSRRDWAALFLERGVDFPHETVRAWKTRFAPLLTTQLRATRQGNAGKSWRCAEPSVKIVGTWQYLYRAIDCDGKLIDSLLSKTRDMDAAKRFFRSAKEATGGKPDRVPTDGHNSYPRALRTSLGRKVVQRTSK